LREWELLVKQGQAVAPYHLGLLYANGQSVLNDDVQARQWYEKATAQGHANPQASLGSLYNSCIIEDGMARRISRWR